MWNDYDYMQLISDCLSSNIILTLALQFLLRVLNLVFVLFAVIMTEATVIYKE